MSDVSLLVVGAALATGGSLVQAGITARLAWGKERRERRAATDQRRIDCYVRLFNYISELGYGRGHQVDVGSAFPELLLLAPRAVAEAAMRAHDAAVAADDQEAITVELGIFRDLVQNDLGIG